MKKYARAKNARRHIVILLDETGSMASRKQEVVSGFDEYIEKAKKDFPDASFTLMRFNSERQRVTHDAVPVGEVGKLENYSPDAMTPLYDSIHKLVTVADSLAGKVFFVIITDGQENASREVDRKAAFDLIKKKEADGWAFAYIGVHADAWDEAQKIGTQPCYTAQAATVGKAYELSNTYASCYFASPDNKTET